jgi:diguanylate cyclase (GGDEF)-like protein
MTPDEVSGLVSFIGTATQLGGALLLSAFFLLLRGHARRRPYFQAWSLAWIWMSLALAAVFLLYRVDLPRNRAAMHAVWFIYQLCKLAFLSSLLAGVLAFGSAVRTRSVLRVAMPVAVIFAAVSSTIAQGLNQVVAMQGPVAAGVFAGCAWRLLRLPRSRSTLGSAATGAFFAAFAALWVFYALAFPWSDRLSGAVLFLVQHNSYLDLLLQMLLGYGMVLLLMEDVKREVDAAHGELAVAHDELKRLALHDSLTGVLNRRAWSEGLGLEAVRASVGAVVMLDLDNLKTVNDVHGHAAGDELLRRLAEVLRLAVRPSDRLYRWGGDEFLLLLPGARAGDARRRVEELIGQANETFTDAPQELLRASIGASEYSGGEDLEAAVNRADAAMYTEKAQHHRSRAALANPAQE